MKISLLATTILATSQFKEVGYLVKQTPSRSMNLPNKERRASAAHGSQKRPTWADGGMSCAASSNTSTKHSSQPTPPLPFTPVSNPLAKYDYRKGDQAKTLDEFKTALAGDFLVTANKAAQDPETFNKNPIMIYGEIHNDPKVPSLRTPKGVLLLESESPDRCMPKHKLDSANRCIFIDTEKAIITEAIINVYKKAATIVDLINPKTISEIKSKVESSSGQLTAAIHMAEEFVKDNFNHAYQRCSSPEKKLHLTESRDAFYKAIDASNDVTINTNRHREKAMLQHCKVAIEQLPSDASATIVVGDLHSRFLANQLSKKFPDKAIVLARDLNALHFGKV